MIDINDARLCSMNGSQRLAEKPFCGARIPLGTEQEVDRMALIDRTIEVFPFIFDLDIRFIHPVGIVRRLEARPTSFLQLWSVTLDPAEDCGVIHRKASFQHHFLEIPIAQSVAQIPADAEQDDFSFKLTPLERIGLTHGIVRYRQ